MKRIWPFMAMDNRQAETYLEKQAAKGYHLSYRGDFLASFDKGPPKKVKYCISSFTWKEEDELEAYKVMAEDAGWKFVDEMQGGCTFVSKENEEPTPLYTDWRDECRLTRKSVWWTEPGVNLSVLLAGYALMLFTPDELQSDIKWWGMNLLIALLCLFVGSSIIRVGGYLISSTLALRRDEPPRKNIYRIGKTLSYIRAAIGYTIHLVLAIVIGYKLLKLYLAGSFYAWSITIALALLVGIFILYIFIEEKHPKIASIIKWIMVGLLLLLIPLVIAACVDA